MSLIPEAVTQRRSSSAGKAMRSSVAQKFFALGLVGVVVALIATQEQSRRVEAIIAGWAIEVVLGVGAQVSSVESLITIGAGTQHIFTVDVSFACSVTLLLTPFILIAAGMVISGRATVSRTVPALIVGSVGLVLINAVRFILIAAMTLAEGLAGFGWAHTIVGSALVIVGLVLIEVLFFLLVTRTKRRH
jgi:exosortase/archaeosortase family protein